MAETKTKRNLPRQCRREDTTTPPSTPIEDERITRLEGHEEDAEEDAAKLFQEEEEGCKGHQ